MQELFRDYPFAFADQSISYLLRELDRATYGRQLDSVPHSASQSAGQETRFPITRLAVKSARQVFVFGTEQTHHVLGLNTRQPFRFGHRSPSASPQPDRFAAICQAPVRTARSRLPFGARTFYY